MKLELAAAAPILYVAKRSLNRKCVGYTEDQSE